MIKTDLVRVSQENYNRKKAEKNAMEYSKHIARKNRREETFSLLAMLLVFVLIGLVGSIELGVL